VSAEMLAGQFRAEQISKASMGPRSCERGDLRRASQVHLQSRCFNGAALV